MSKFWLGKKVLITGHTGFKGSWLSLWLQWLGAEVIGYALKPPTHLNLFTIANVAKNMTSVLGDIRDFSAIASTVNTYRPDIIIHMAAQSLVRYSYKYPLETYSTNVMGTVNLLEAARQTENTRAIVNVTTDKCYENKNGYWSYRENDRLGGRDPYSNSKACAELVSSAYRHSYFNQPNSPGLATARAGNVIGGGDWAEDRLVPDIINACKEKKPVIIRNPQALRPWQHVLEPLGGYLLLAERLYEAPTVFSSSWNFGPQEEDVVPVAWLVEFIIKAWQANTAWQYDDNQHPHEEKCLKLDCSKAKAELGWRPAWNLEKGLQATIAWYQAYQEQAAMQEYTLSQIKAFMNESLRRNTK